MSRYVLIRTDSAPSYVVEEAALPTEAELHDALTNHPELIPVADLGMKDAVVVGRESALVSGYADLVLVDQRGRICLVEVKNEGNPDTRRVVAQLLDYAAALWGLSIEEFEAQVLRPYLTSAGHSGPAPGVGEHVTEKIEPGSDGGTEVADQLAQSLISGDFALVVAAPRIPLGVQRVMEYLNSRGQRLYGLEVSYFKGPVECFVPRLVVKPLVSDPAGESATATAVDEETYLQQVPEWTRSRLVSLLTDVGDAGGEVVWRNYGASVTVTRQKQRQVAFLEAKRVGVTLKASADFPQQPFDAARERLTQLGAGAETKDFWYRSVPFGEIDDETLGEVLAVVRELVVSLAPTIDMEMLATAVETTFVRKDHNVWAAHLPALSAFQGRYLQGELTSVASNESVAVHLIPLAGGQPGWRPRFSSSNARDTFWPAAASGQTFAIRIQAASAE